MSEPTLQDRFHLIGIGGAGMSVVAELLASRGATVEGSDREESAVLEHLRLTLDLVVDRIFQRFEGVDVFHLRPCAELI